MAFLFADENFPMPAVKVLRQMGHDVQTLLQIGQAGLAIPDDELLRLTTSLGRCLITLNRKDFIKLHGQEPNHAGIIICKADSDFDALARRVDSCLKSQHDLTEGQLLRVQRTA
ncbi:DUF5615 family PIN-like protein [Spirosoma utsteinense]|uniref:DUF5615 domain-containing protein n=1 Tax=Spirosoma utsteinense TaxID=2585773 RepID=A0ABR6W4L5_9BACT|nr:DUF5615 family PIN-like protein [Spirosoma utsteinense]MBC3784799.1 hypothetical protein [Spirosoma utsteinense]MBC3791164.1 hypothetical protein [Spirosoma utsteinense]